MASRFPIVVVALSLFACQMDNPAFDVGDELAGASEESSTSGDTEVGESTSVNDSDTGSTDAESSSTATTDEACMPGEPCGTCHKCNMAGECVPTPMVACEGEGTQCSDYVFGFGEATCYAFAEASLPASCNQAGECVAPSPMLCPPAKGEVILACDLVCVKDFEACQAHTPIAELDFAAMCVLDGSETDQCGPHCSPFDEIVKNGCVDGVCEATTIEVCAPYSCNPQTAECFVGCELLEECALGFICDFDTNVCLG